MARIADGDAAVQIGLDQRAHEGGLVLHVALERLEELPLVEPRELEAGDRDEQDEEVDHEQAHADAPDEAQGAVAEPAVHAPAAL